MMYLVSIFITGDYSSYYDYYIVKDAISAGNARDQVVAQTGASIGCINVYLLPDDVYKIAKSSRRGIYLP